LSLKKGDGKKEKPKKEHEKELMTKTAAIPKKAPKKEENIFISMI